MTFTSLPASPSFSVRIFPVPLTCTDYTVILGSYPHPALAILVYRPCGFAGKSVVYGQVCKIACEVPRRLPHDVKTRLPPRQNHRVPELMPRTDGWGRPSFSENIDQKVPFKRYRPPWVGDPQPIQRVFSLSTSKTSADAMDGELFS